MISVCCLLLFMLIDCSERKTAESSSSRETSSKLLMVSAYLTKEETKRHFRERLGRDVLFFIFEALFGEWQKLYERQREAKRAGMLDSSLMVLPEETPKTPSLMDIIANSPNELLHEATAVAVTPTAKESEPAPSESQRNLKRLINSFKKEPIEKPLETSIQSKPVSSCDKECSCDLLNDLGVDGLGEPESSQLRRDFDRLVQLAAIEREVKSSEPEDKLAELSKVFFDEKNELVQKHKLESEMLRKQIESLLRVEKPSKQDFGQQYESAEEAKLPLSSVLPLKSPKKVTFEDESLPKATKKSGLPLGKSVF